MNCRWAFLAGFPRLVARSHLSSLELAQSLTGLRTLFVSVLASSVAKKKYLVPLVQNLIFGSFLAPSQALPKYEDRLARQARSERFNALSTTCCITLRFVNLFDTCFACLNVAWIWTQVCLNLLKWNNTRMRKSAVKRIWCNIVSTFKIGYWNVTGDLLCKI
jgi:hypothetical protein